MRALRWLLVGFYALMCAQTQAAVIGVGETVAGGTIALSDTSSAKCLELSKSVKYPFFDAFVTAPNEQPLAGCWTYLPNGRVMIDWGKEGRYTYPAEAFPKPEKK